MANRDPNISDPEFTKKFFFVSGFVSYLKNDDKTYYLACPDESCKKKVMEESVGWRCENCNKTYPNICAHSQNRRCFRLSLHQFLSE